MQKLIGLFSLLALILTACSVSSTEISPSLTPSVSKQTVPTLLSSTTTTPKPTKITIPSVTATETLPVLTKAPLIPDNLQKISIDNLKNLEIIAEIPFTQVLPDHNIYAITISGDGSKMVSLSESWKTRDQSLLVWDLMTDAQLLLIEDSPYPLWWASFSQDNQYLWVIQDKNLDKYNLANSEPKATLRFPAHIGRSAAISPDEKYIVAGKYDGTMDQSTISFYPFGAENPIYSEQMVYMISSFHFSPDSKMVSGSSSKIGELRINIWNPETGLLIQDFVNYSGGPAFSPDSTRVAFVKENHISVFSTDTWILQSSFRLDDSSNSMIPKFFFGENQILALSDTYHAKFVNIASGEVLLTFPEQVSVINYSPASNVVFTFWNLGNIKLWGIQ